jgi:hypothetical protein
MIEKLDPSEASDRRIIYELVGLKVHPEDGFGDSFDEDTG